MDAHARQRSRPRWRAAVVDYLGLLGVVVVLVAIFSVLTRHFLRVKTFTTIANQIPDITVVAVGMTFVLIIANIDLSVGSVMALCGAVLAACMKHGGWPLPAAAVACLAAGLLCGAANGLISVGWGIPSFIVTLGMLELARGGTYLVTNMGTIYVGSPLEVVADTKLFGLSLPFYIAVAIVVVGQLVLSRTIFGRHLVAIGTNEEAVRLSGIDPRPRKLAVFMLCGLLTGLAALFHMSRMSGSANPNEGVGFELEAIAAVVIGGTSLMGGRGSVVRTFFGVLIIAVLRTGLSQLGAETSHKRLITGAVIIAAVIVDHYRHRLAKAPRLVAHTSEVPPSSEA